MSANVLDSVQDTLNSRGTLDVKFLFKREALAVPKSDLEEDLANVMSKFLAGEFDVVNQLPSEELTVQSD